MSIRKFLFAPLLLAAAVAQAQQPAYEMTLIPRLDYPNGINDLGQIAGNGFNADGALQAAVLTPGATPALRFLGAPGDRSADINNAGQVTGDHLFAPGQLRAAIFSNGAIQDLGAPGAPSSIGRAINAGGQVAGALGSDPLHVHAFLYANGQMSDLGAFSGDRSDAFGIDDAGQVVGTSLVAGVGGEPNTWRAFEYSGGALNELGIGGTFSIARDINNAGQVVGEWTPSSESGSHAFVYKDGVLSDLGDLGGGNTTALSINDRGDIVGYGATGRGDTLHGFIYVDGKLVDLNTLLLAPNGWQITRTSAINEGRQIAALACRIDNAFQCMPALLSPVPEPAALVLWSGGLLLLAARRVLRLGPPSPPAASRSFADRVNDLCFAGYLKLSRVADYSRDWFCRPLPPDASVLGRRLSCTGGLRRHWRSRLPVRARDFPLRLLLSSSRYRDLVCEPTGPDRSWAATCTPRKFPSAPALRAASPCISSPHRTSA